MEKNKRDLCSVESSSATHHIHLRAEPFLLLFKCSDHPLSYPCAKIVATFPEGQSVHNLGWDSLDGDDEPTHVPSLSITLFLALLSELSDHIIDFCDENGASHVSISPPFPMTQCSIDSVDVTCLGDTDTASWSSVVFCIAVNLQWLSQLVLPSDVRHGNNSLFHCWAVFLPTKIILAMWCINYFMRIATITVAVDELQLKDLSTGAM